MNDNEKIEIINNVSIKVNKKNNEKDEVKDNGNK